MNEYLVTGYNFGRFEVREGRNAGSMQPYANLFAIGDFAGERNPDYQFEGQKALKLACLSADILDPSIVGKRCEILFNENKRVVLIKPVKA